MFKPHKYIIPQIQITKSPSSGSHLQTQSRLSSAISTLGLVSPAEQSTLLRPNSIYIRSQDSLMDPSPMARRGRNVDLKAKFQQTTGKLLSILHDQKSSNDVVNQAKASLLKIVNSRSDEDFLKIESFMLRLEFIQKLRDDNGMHLVSEFCKNLYYQRFNEGEEVIHINREGKTFYVILSGFVDVYLYVPKTEYALQMQKKFAKSQDDSLLKYNDTSQFEKTLVRTLGSGESFGEYSLLDQKYRTSATILTKTQCEFTCLDRKQYWDILGRIKRDELEKKLEFIHKLHIFYGWSDQDIRTISYHFEYVQFNRDNKILVEGGTNKYFYFINEGQFITLKNIRDEGDDAAFFQKIQRIELISVSLIGYGEIFGQDEYVGCQDNYFSIDCTEQNSSAYKISYQDLSKRLWETETKDKFFEHVFEQFQWRSQRYQQQKQIKVAAKESKMRIDNKDTIELHSKSLEKINNLYQSTQNHYSPYQLRRKEQSPPNKKVNFDDSKSFKKFPTLNEYVQPNESILTSREQSRLRPRVNSQKKLQRMETAKLDLDKQAQIALKKGKIERFAKNNQDVIEEGYDIDTSKLDIVPRISTRTKALRVDYMDAMAGFEALSIYQLTPRADLRSDNYSTQQQINDYTSKSQEVSPLRNLEQPCTHLNPVGLNSFLKYAARFQNTDLSRIADSFYNLVWRKKTELSFESNLRLFKKEAKDITKSQLVELLKYYLDKTFANLKNSSVPAQHIEYQLNCIKQVILMMCQRESRYLYDLIAKIQRINIEPRSFLRD